MTKPAAVLLALFGLAAYGPVQAQQPGNPVYFGAKLGMMDPDRGDEATNVGLLAGYTLMEDRTGAFALEGEYTRSFDDGQVNGNDWDLETLAAYLAYRTTGDVFLKAKAGYGWWDVNVDGGAGGFEGDDWDFTFGAGVGFRLSRKAGLELEYAVIQEDLDFLSLGFFTHF
jgi:hypothetical protein